MTKLNHISHILHAHLNDGNVTAMFKRTLIAVAVDIMAVFALCIMIAWGVRG